MYAARTLRVAAAAFAAVVAVGTLGAMPAQAARPAPAPTNLHADVTANQDGSYHVTSTWDAVANATAYRVSLTKGGATLASAKVSTIDWSTSFTTSPGTATLSVRGLVGKKPGKVATLPVLLGDVVAPDGSFSSSWDNNTGDATLTQESLTDNSPVSEVTRTVNWDDGSAPEAWTSGTTINHTYPLTEMRYVPKVTLKDASNNSATVDAAAVVINDSEAPTGTFVNQTATAWAAFTQVTVSQSDISDNWTPDGLITRSVDWGDGTTTAWTGSGNATHVYAAAGNYTPVVTITDEAGNSTPESTSQVVVTADTKGPKVTLTLPKAKHSVKAWKTLRGKATDAETGVKSVWLKAVENRGGSWFGYNATTHAWVKATSKKKAFGKANAFNLTTNAQHQWAAKLVKLRKGTLVYKVRATDQVKNRSATLTHKATLTKA